MSVLICDGIRLAYGVDVVLENISFSVNSADKLGIIGVNGAGKSTLFSIILGRCEPTSGNVYIKNGATVGILEQINDSHIFGMTVLETALEANSSLIDAEKRLEELKKRIENGDESAVNAYVTATEKYISDGGNEFRAKTRTMLKKFGFEDADLVRSADSLSGGQKTKLLLVRLLLSQPDIILLDEPTNHLDTNAREWLENFIRSSSKTFLIISHDRYFLDRVTNKTLEISRGLGEMYDGSYSVFREKKKALDAAKLKHYNLQQKEIARIEAFIENQRKWNREKNIIAAESRQKALDKMIKLERPKGKEKGISFSVAGSGAQGHDVLSVRNLKKGFTSVPLFNSLSFDIKKGERLFIYGANGCGKSTLLKIITGRLNADGGIVELGYNQTLGYYDQEQQILDNSSTVIDELWNVYSDKTNTEIRTMLASFGFYGDDVFKTVGVLSGGERARLSIAKMVSCGVSLLVLDEPTNHLDIDSCEMLEKALSEYDGTIIAVSHDRYFIRSLATSVLEIDSSGYDEGYRLYKFGFDEFIEKRVKNTAIAVQVERSAAGKENFELAKQRKSRLRTINNQLAAAEKEISSLEKRLEGIVSDINSEENAADYEKLARLYEEKTATEDRVLELYAKCDDLERELQELSE